MGKRPTNKTKSGKFMNPTDQARKEARKKELKKNKKQRQLVRTAVLKGKNPSEIISELEKVDDMEYNVHAPPVLNEKVLKEKRAKLIGTWNRVIRLYEKDNVEQYMELKKLWHRYLMRKNEVAANFEAVKNAQNVRVEEIPLPSFDNEKSSKTDEIPLPPKSSILKKPSSVLDSLKPKVCPGVPSIPPPSLEDYDVENRSNERPKKIRFDDDQRGIEDEDEVAPGEEEIPPKVDELQRKMLAMSGQDVDAYMKEMEEVHRQTQAQKAADLQTRLSRMDEPHPPPGLMDRDQQQHPPPPPPPPLPPHMKPPMRLPPGPPPRPPMFIRPSAPPLRPGMAPPGVRLPPGPPPGRPPVPPGPPPGRPPMGGQRPRMGPPGMSGMPRPPIKASKPQGVVSAGPQLISDGVIEAKPKMRNLRSDVTRFIPTNLRVKREDPKNQHKRQQDPMTKDVFAKHSKPQAPQKSKDDAYAQFMSEMDQLMK